MKRLLHAIDARLNAQVPDVTWYLGAGVESPSLPYGVYRHTGSNINDYIANQVDRLGLETLEVHTVQFSVFSSSYETALDAIDDVQFAMEQTDLVLSAKSDFIAAYQISRALELDPDYTQAGQEVWQGILLMEFTIQRRVT